MTGLGFPNDMKPFVKDGTSPVFGLWSVPDLGYLSYQVADKLVKGEITGAEGETFTVPSLNSGQPYTIGKDSVVDPRPGLPVRLDERRPVQLLARSRAIGAPEAPPRGAGFRVKPAAREA